MNITSKGGNKLELINRTAIVTGAGSGLGRQIALNFAKKGAELILVDVNLEGAEAVAEEIRGLGRKALVIKTDITKETDVKNMVVTTMEAMGKIEILVNSAGISRTANIQDITLEQWNKMININLTGTFLCCREVIKQMIKQEYGKIINISSISGVTGRGVGVDYAATKSGVIGITRTLALQVAEFGINVNAIAPGPIITPIHDTWLKEDLDKLLATVPFNRAGKPQDIAEAALFLASNQSGWITGEVLSVNGGIFMG